MAIWQIVEDCIFQRWLLPHLPSYMLFKNIVIHHWGLGSLCSFSFQLGRFGRMFHLMEFGEDDIIWLSRIDNKSQCNFHMAFWDTCFWILSCHVISLIIWRPPWYKEAKSCTEFMCKMSSDLQSAFEFFQSRYDMCEWMSLYIISFPSKWATPRYQVYQAEAPDIMEQRCLFYCSISELLTKKIW